MPLYIWYHFITAGIFIVDVLTLLKHPLTQHVLTSGVADAVKTLITTVHVHRLWHQQQALFKGHGKYCYVFTIMLYHKSK